MNLKKYNEVCQSILFSLSIVISLFILGSFLINKFFLNDDVRIVNEIKLDEEKVYEKLDVLGAPIVYKGSDFSYLPVFQYDTGNESNENKTNYGSSVKLKKSSNFSQAGYLYMSYIESHFLGCVNCNISNLIFINRKNQETKRLLGKPSLINSFYVPTDKDEQGNIIKFFRDFLLLSKVDQDSNKDGKLSFSDATVLYRISLDGSQMEQISPAGMDFLNFQIDDEHKIFYLRVKEDSNKDGKFDKKDLVKIYHSSLLSLAKIKLLKVENLKNSTGK